MSSLSGPRETLSSYEFIQKSKFVMVYNSTIGLEASIMGARGAVRGEERALRNTRPCSFRRRWRM